MYVPPSHDHIIPPIRVRIKILSQLLKNGGFVEIIPRGRNYSFNIHYIKTQTQRAREYGLNLEKYEKNPNRAISIDFGVNNFLTVFNNFGARFPIFKGSAIRKHHPKLFSHNAIAYNLGLISHPHQPLTTQKKRIITKFIATPPISFSPSNGIPTKELKREKRLNKSKIKPQRYQMSPNKFLTMTQTAYI